jgi:two-component system phosphate regulon sensor histidine kinase PhoR
MSTVDPGIASFVAALPDPSYLLDRRGTVLVANAAAASLFSVRIGEPLTARLRVPDLLTALEHVSQGGEPERVEFVERVPTERRYAGWFAGIGRRDDRRRPELIVLIVDDLTERYRADRVRVDFVANASHELRTPLASLAGFIETLQGPARSDPEAQDKFLSIMHEQATRMSRLIDDLLSLSRIEMKAHLRPSESVDLVEVARHVADALDPLARELKVRIETDLPDQVVLVPGDHDELVQIFDNLVENACRYGRSGGRVEFSVKPPRIPGGTCTASVRDFGPGIAPEHLPRLTERFYRVDAEVSRQHRGTGLGLAIVKHIANRHRARLGIDSTPGEGALFTVEFPVTIPAESVKMSH